MTMSVSSCCIDSTRDEIGAMQRQEESYFNPSIKKPNEQNVFRPFMVRWMITIHDTFQLCPVVVPTALYYLDQTACDLNNPLDYQLVGLAALHLAVKVHETRIFQLKQLLEMGNVCFTPQNVLDTERRILKACAWKLHPPVPEAFVYVYGKLFEKCPQIVSSALYTLRQGMAAQLGKPSIVAYASLLVAMEHSYISVQQKQALCLGVLQVSGYSATTLGLPEAYKALFQPTAVSSFPASPTITTKQPSLLQVYPVSAPPPLVVNEQPPNNEQSLLSPESREEGEYREVITCAEESIEVTWCPSKPDADVWDAISPKNIADF